MRQSNAMNLATRTIGTVTTHSTTLNHSARTQFCISRVLAFVRALLFPVVLVALFCTTAIVQAQITAVFSDATDPWTGEEAQVQRAVDYWNNVLNNSVTATTTVQRATSGGGTASGWNITLGAAAGNFNTQMANSHLEMVMVHELAHSLGITSGQRVTSGGVTTIYGFWPDVSSGMFEIGTITDTDARTRWHYHLFAPAGTDIYDEINGTVIDTLTDITAFRDLNGAVLALDPNNPFIFGGANAMSVWGDGTAKYVPVVSGRTSSSFFRPGSDLVHPITPFGNLNYTYSTSLVSQR